MGVKWVAITNLEVFHMDEGTKVITAESEVEAEYVGSYPRTGIWGLWGSDEGEALVWSWCLILGEGQDSVAEKERNG